jgi:hypothetical protein
VIPDAGEEAWAELKFHESRASTKCWLKFPWPSTKPAGRHQLPGESAGSKGQAIILQVRKWAWEMAQPQAGRKFFEESYSGVPDFWRDEPRFRNSA